MEESDVQLLAKFAKRLVTDKKGKVKAARTEKEIGNILQGSVCCGSVGLPVLALAKDILSISIAMEKYQLILAGQDPEQQIWLAKMETALNLVKRALPIDYSDDEVFFLVDELNPDLPRILNYLAEKGSATGSAIGRRFKLKLDVALEDLSLLNQYGLVVAVISEDLSQLKNYMDNLAKIPYTITSRGRDIIEALGISYRSSSPATVTSLDEFREKKKNVQ